MLEEIGYNPTVMHELGFEIISDLDNLHAQKIERVFPVIAPPYLTDTIGKLWEYLKITDEK